jgi:Tfp pilus assembly protein PilZ
MPEKRAFVRKKRRVLVDFATETSGGTGFTSDLSQGGMFISTVRIPKIGERLTTRVHLPRGGEVTIAGRVVRARSRPGALSRTAGNGFGLKILDFSEEYDDFCAAL